MRLSVLRSHLFIHSLIHYFITSLLHSFAHSFTSGLPADGTMAAAVIYTIGDLHRPGCVIDYPKGGGGAVIAAMVSDSTTYTDSKLVVSREEILGNPGA